MAVQIPDPGTGNGQTGDNEYVFRKKVKDNFNDQTNAASRLVGTGTGNVMLVGAFGLGSYAAQRIDAQKDALTPNGFWRAPNMTSAPIGFQAAMGITFSYDASNQVDLGVTMVSQVLAYRSIVGGVVKPVIEVWTKANATKDSNGFLKAASPIVKVFADKVELNGDAESQNVMYTKNGIGDYTITTQSGLSTDGWYIELPKDMNGNPKVAVTLQETNGVISLKSYKRIFSMETFTFEPDLNEPLDIPDGRWIDLRLNEIPVEPSEPESEV